MIATGNEIRAEMELVECGDNFKYKNQTEAKSIGIPGFYCPKSRDLFVLGNALSSTYKYFEINIIRCDSSTSTCQLDSVIDEVILNMEIGVFLVNSYFDSDDYSNPINTYIDDRFYFNLIPQFTKSSVIYIQ